MSGHLEIRSKLNSTKSIVTIILAFLLVHGLLLGFGLVNDNSLLSGDRSMSRNETIAYVFNVEKIGKDKASLKNSQTPNSEPYIGDRILSSGHAGDYLIQGAILKLTNRNMLVAVQLVLALFSTLCIFSLLKHFGFSINTATLATLFYLVLPGSLLPAHQLSSEAIFIPFAIIGCYLLVITSERKGVDIAFIFGLLSLSIAIFVRPQLILFPFLLAIIYLWFSVKKSNTILFTVLPVSLLFSVIWSIFIVSEEGSLEIGGSDRSIGMTFYDTVAQMDMSGDIDYDFEVDDEAFDSRSMPFSEFATVVIKHPFSYLRQRTTSMVNFFVNPGAYSLVIRHLNYFEKDDDNYYWQHLRARSGIFGSVIEIFKRGPLFTALILGTALVWFLVVCFAIAGLLPFVRDKNIGWFAKALLLTLAVYQVGIVMLLSVGARWQQRSLIDIIIIVLAIYGLRLIVNRLASKKRVSQFDSVGTR